MSLLTVQRIALVTAVAATVPYLTLKTLWLGGSQVGVTSDAGLAEMHSTRYVAGNAITIALMLLAAAFAVVLTRPSAHRIPAAVVLVLGAGATGLLAPIVLGLPIGVGIQAALGYDAGPEQDTGLASWVFALVYGGFGALGLALAVLVLLHVLDRWGHLLSEPPVPPSAAAMVAGAVGLLPFAAAMAWWGLAGVGDTGPQGMDLPAQRTVLAVTGGLAAAALLAPFARGAARRRPRLAWLVTWTGCCVAALEGPTFLLLAQNGDFQPAVAAVALLATPGASVFGIGVLRRRLASTERPQAAEILPR